MSVTFCVGILTASVRTLIVRACQPLFVPACQSLDGASMRPPDVRFRAFLPFFFSSSPLLSLPFQIPNTNRIFFLQSCR